MSFKHQADRGELLGESNSISSREPVQDLTGKLADTIRIFEDNSDNLSSLEENTHQMNKAANDFGNVAEGFKLDNLRYGIGEKEEVSNIIDMFIAWIETIKHATIKHAIGSSVIEHQPSYGYWNTLAKGTRRIFSKFRFAEFKYPSLFKKLNNKIEELEQLVKPQSGGDRANKFVYDRFSRTFMHYINKINNIIDRLGQGLDKYKIICDKDEMYTNLKRYATLATRSTSGISTSATASNIRGEFNVIRPDEYIDLYNKTIKAKTRGGTRRKTKRGKHRRTRRHTRR